MLGPISRILARYLAASLVTIGLFLPEEANAIATDPDVILAIGGILAFIVEAAYSYAKKKGWKT